jgi:hypothetical protein
MGSRQNPALPLGPHRVNRSSAGRDASGARLNLNPATLAESLTAWRQAVHDQPHASGDESIQSYIEARLRSSAAARVALLTRVGSDCD